jgi:hypothetical protein
MADAMRLLIGTVESAAMRPRKAMAARVMIFAVR